jgi:hypothetical protein
MWEPWLGERTREFAGKLGASACDRPELTCRRITHRRRDPSAGDIAGADQAPLEHKLQFRIQNSEW